MKKYFKTYLLFLLLSSTVLISAEEDIYLKINKSFEIFNSVIREILNNYVVDLDPKDLIKDGIEGILVNLDPYTEFIEGDEIEDIDIISSGQYVGLGVTVAVIDSMLTVVDINDGYPAQKSGIRVGDRIYKADTAVIINKNNDELRKYTKGVANTSVNLMIIRDGRNDTMQINVMREEINIKNVPYSGFLDDSTGYIKLDKFSSKTAEDVKQALLELKTNNNLKSIIFDLRDNPGGLLQSAVDVLELFLPENLPVVATKGKLSQSNFTFYTKNQPIDTKTPLAVIINQNSASASEIVAGALQDYDRAVIVGTRSFGKGLVQTVFDLPFNSSLKMTTAKYYSPSGRCLQRLNYRHGNKGTDLNIHRDSVFFTQNKRPVIESNGITPDTIIKLDTLTDYYISLLKSNLIFKFANIFTSRLDSLSSDFSITQDIIDEFSDFLKENNFQYASDLEKYIDSVKKFAMVDNSAKDMKELNKICNQLLQVKKNYFEENIEQVKKDLIFEITRRLVPYSDVLKLLIPTDKSVQLARNILNGSSYGSILKVASKL